MNLNTSFTGKDLLFTRLRAGNFFGSAFSGSPVGMAALDKAFGGNAGTSSNIVNTNNLVQIDRLYYSFPIGKEFTATIGPRLRNTEMIAFRPQAYNPEILDFFTLAGAPGAYNKATGGGFGLTWKQNVKKGNPYLTISANFISEDSQSGNPNDGGMFSATGRNNVTVQVGGRGTNWGVAALYRYGTCGTDLRRGTPMASSDLMCNLATTATTTGLANNNASSNSIGLGAFWQPVQTGWIPSISLGWGYSGLSQSGSVTNSSTSTGTNNIANVAAAQSWSAMFQWDDAFAKGNSAGFAFGQGVMTTATRNGIGANDANYAFEWFYRFRVSDNISITPAIFYLSNPLGQQQNTQGTVLNNTGILVNTRFTF